MNPGKLYIVATPIGNLSDISQRARDVLSQVDLIACEDTRHSRPLLQQYGITTKLVSFHMHNEEKQSETFLQHLLQGGTLAMISDAGTPLISDPGFRLVEKAHENQIKVIPIPGPCSPIAALSAAGLPAEKFTFWGFLNAKQKSRRTELESLKSHPHTLIFFEAPHRVRESLEDMMDIFSKDRLACLAKEITKQFETILRGTLADIYDWLIADDKHQKGEFIILISPETPSEISADAENQEITRILTILLKTLPKREAVDITQSITGAPKNKIYKIALQLL